MLNSNERSAFDRWFSNLDGEEQKAVVSTATKMRESSFLQGADETEAQPMSLLDCLKNIWASGDPRDAT